MKVFIIVSLLAVATFARLLSAAEGIYQCNNVGGTEEWRIAVDLDHQLASFFDSDATVEVPLKSVRSLESLPPQMLYTFEGTDTGGAQGDRLRIEFNATKLKASVTFLPRRGRSETLEALDGCEGLQN